MENQTTLNHTEYLKKVKKYTEAQLRYIIQDATEALHAMPNGHKAGWYQDEIHYCAMELKKRNNTK